MNRPKNLYFDSTDGMLIQNNEQYIKDLEKYCDYLEDRIKLLNVSSMVSGFDYDEYATLLEQTKTIRNTLSQFNNALAYACHILKEEYVHHNVDGKYKLVGSEADWMNILLKEGNQDALD